MATVTSFTAGSVARAVTVGSHDEGSPNRVRRSSEDNFWTSTNSMAVMETTAACKIPVRQVHQVEYPSPLIDLTLPKARDEPRTRSEECRASRHPRSRRVPRTLLSFQAATNGSFEHVDCRAVAAERAEVLEGFLPVRPLGVEIVKESDAAAPVGEFDGLTCLADFR
jgi:hypothetical protein